MLSPQSLRFSVSDVFVGGAVENPHLFSSQLSCKLEREFRCVELAELMTPSVVSLAIRYASRSRRMALAERLSQLALEKAGQIQEGEPEPEEAESSAHTPG